MGLVEQFIARAKERPRRVALPEGEDERVAQAACRLASEGIAHPILLGGRDAILSRAAGGLPEGVRIVDPAASPDVLRYAEAYARRRAGVTPGAAARLVRRPLYFGGMMVSEGDAEAMVAGASRPTAQVIAAGALTVGYEEGVSQASSLFLMALPGPPESLLVYADAAVAVDPSSSQLAEIAVVTARNARRLLGIEPRVAMLSFSTHGSARHARVDKVQEATRLARQMAPGLVIDGDLQADAALSPRVAQKKCPGFPVQGDANVLIFPDLDAGNIAYKLTQYLAGAQAIGPIIQGFRRPVNDLSRGASVDDIVAVAAIAALQAAEGG
ncbi:MAG: phosphate acetyltransferase [Candidatus Handelsmanbacteria bacterium RIFCSPLOWO2_12_FULL_64_10]|uniref:Phosphate acetyltransferase n=1 Tax=Handelsmanbacteria sp. (strain RIFCSPLOWO2_12_FULL_64_10) TaxID=1817868 RepID=A0A1F6C1Y7_HANXR|nr:MAG: phosphate acetyltransferase [Candidatus Handelsmanbacteria bacterium RIFCSPLOWO2_12_FULL_64_10]